MGFRDSLKEKRDEAVAAQAERGEANGRAKAEEEARVATLPKWEYQVKRVGEDKQEGMLGSQRMEEIFNGEGRKGWELVAINEERATFERPLR